MTIQYSQMEQFREQKSCDISEYFIKPFSITFVQHIQKKQGVQLVKKETWIAMKETT